MRFHIFPEFLLIHLSWIIRSFLGFQTPFFMKIYPVINCRFSNIKNLCCLPFTASAHNAGDNLFTEVFRICFSHSPIIHLFLFMSIDSWRKYYTAEVLNVWLEEVLLPTLPKGSTLIMDNAAFHKSAKTKELIEKSECHLLFLPTYSPDLNPIEHWWHKIKSILRPLVQQGSHDLHTLLDHCLST